MGDNKRKSFDEKEGLPVYPIQLEQDPTLQPEIVLLVNVIKQAHIDSCLDRKCGESMVKANTFFAKQARQFIQSEDFDYIVGELMGGNPKTARKFILETASSKRREVEH